MFIKKPHQSLSKTYIMKYNLQFMYIYNIPAIKTATPDIRDERFGINKRLACETIFMDHHTSPYISATVEQVSSI